MPTQKDIEFAKLLISKEVISRAALQRILDELDATRKKDPKISIEAFVVKRKIITNQELNIIKAAGQQRVVHCSKCRTMYRVNSEDVGKRFKCKTCGMSVIVPIPGQTKSQKVKELVDKKSDDKVSIDSHKVLKGVSKEEYENSLKKEANNKENSNPEVTINLDEHDAINDDFENVTALNVEATINLGLDDTDDDGIMIADEQPEATLQIQNHLEHSEEDSDIDLMINNSAFENPEITINLTPEDEEDDEQDSYFKIASKHEATINLGLDDTDDDDQAILVADEIQNDSISPNEAISQRLQNLSNPEATISLGLDDIDGEAEDALLVEDQISMDNFDYDINMNDNNSFVSNNPEPTINLGLDDADDDDYDNAVFVQDELQKNDLEMTVNLSHDLGEYEDDDSDAIVINPDEANDFTSQNFEQSTSAKHEPTINLGLDDTDDDDDDNAVFIEDSPQKNNNLEMTINLSHDLGEYEDDDSDAMVINPDEANDFTSQNFEQSASAKHEPTINLGLDDADDDDDDNAVFIEDSPQRNNNLEMTINLSHDLGEYEDDDSDAMVINPDEANDFTSQNFEQSASAKHEPTINLGLDDADDDDDNAVFIEDSPQRNNNLEMTVDLTNDLGEYEDDDSDAMVINPDEVNDFTSQNFEQSASKHEPTINLGLDDADDDDDDNAVFIEDSPQRNNNLEMTVDLTNDLGEYEDDDSDQMIIAPQEPKTPKKQSGELTIDLGLDDEN